VLYDSGYMTRGKKETIKERNSGKKTHEYENEQMKDEKKICIQKKKNTIKNTIQERNT
jgi:hypothetical protein